MFENADAHVTCNTLLLRWFREAKEAIIKTTFILFYLDSLISGRGHFQMYKPDLSL